MSKKIFVVLISAIMVFATIEISVFSEQDELLTLEELREEYGALTVEAYNIGQGFLIKPSLYEKDGRSAGAITSDFLESKNIGYAGSISYFSGFEFDDRVEAVYPEYLEPYQGDFYTVGDGDGMLREFDYSMYAGWCFTINDWWASLGADAAYPGQEIEDYNTGGKIVLGDVIRWHYSVYGYGVDCGFPSNAMAEWMGGNLFTQEDKSDLLFILAAIKDYYGNLETDDVYETALMLAADPLATRDDIDTQEAILTAYIEDTFFTDTDAEICFSFPEENVNVTVIFADYEEGSLNNIKRVTVVTEKTNGENIMSVTIPDGINLSDGDKVMFWETDKSCAPVCQAYVVKDEDN